jgi:hypothetical protein
VRQLPLPHRSPGAVVDPAGHRRVQDQPWLLSRPITAADAPAQAPHHRRRVRQPRVARRQHRVSASLGSRADRSMCASLAAVPMTACAQVPAAV